MRLPGAGRPGGGDRPPALAERVEERQRPAREARALRGPVQLLGLLQGGEEDLTAGTVAGQPRRVCTQGA